MLDSPFRTTCSVLLLCCVASAAGAAAPDMEFTTTPLGASVSVLQRLECNVVASAGEDGIVMIDTCGAEVANKLLASVRRLSDKPLRFVINTHVHADHTGANAFFQKLAPIIASNNVRKWLVTGNERLRDKPSPPDALPTITFDGEMTLHLNGEEIRLLKLPPAHTDGDVVVFFKKANVVAMGDVFMAMGNVSKAPSISLEDRWYGGGLLHLMETQELLLPQIPVDAKIVPGHGPISTRADIVRGLEVMRQMKTVVETGVRAGKTPDQLIAERPFDKFRDSFPTWASSDASLDGLVRRFHAEISAPAPNL